jgi:hypothetical protein
MNGGLLMNNKQKSPPLKNKNRKAAPIYDKFKINKSLWSS